MVSHIESSDQLRHSKIGINIERDHLKIGAPLHSGLEVWGSADVSPDASGSTNIKKSPDLGRLGD